MNRQMEKLEENLIESDGIILIDDEAFYDSLVATTDDDCAVYDYDIMVEEYAKFHGITPEEAADHINYNIIRYNSYLTGKRPIIIYPLR